MTSPNWYLRAAWSIAVAALLLWLLGRVLRRRAEGRLRGAASQTLPLLLFVFATFVSCRRESAAIDSRDSAVVDVDLGVVPPGDNITPFSFRVENPGTSPLHVNRVTTSCGCVVLDAREFDVAPGDSKLLNGKLNVLRDGVKNSYDVHLYTNQSQDRVRTYRLWVTGRVGRKAEPSTVDFGVVDPGSRVTRYMSILADHGDPVLEGDPRPASSDMTVSRVTAVQSPGFESQTYEIELVVPAHMRPGRRDSTVRIATGPDSEFAVPVRFVVGDGLDVPLAKVVHAGRDSSIPVEWRGDASSAGAVEFRVRTSMPQFVVVNVPPPTREANCVRTGVSIRLTSKGAASAPFACDLELVARLRGATIARRSISIAAQP